MLDTLSPQTALEFQVLVARLARLARLGQLDGAALLEVVASALAAADPNGRNDLSGADLR